LLTCRQVLDLSNCFAHPWLSYFRTAMNSSAEDMFFAIKL
jgi:hypothetical protein